MKSKNYNKKGTFWILLIILSTLIYAVGDVLLKQGNIDLGSTFQRLLEGEFWIALVTSMPIIASIGLALLAKLVMGIVLSKNPLATSEGFFLAFSVIFIFLMGMFFFGESVEPTDVLGLIIIVIGILFVYLPSSNHETDATKEEVLSL